MAKDHGALSHRVGRRAEVIGRSQSNRLRVRFDGEDRPVSIRPHLVRVVTAEDIVEELVQVPCDLLAAHRSPGEGTVSDQVEPTIVKTDDPWIDAYLAFRGAVLNGEVEMVADVEEYAREAQRGLPAGGPSTPAAMFITGDVAVTFAGESFPVLMTALWTPHETRGQES